MDGSGENTPEGTWSWEESLKTAIHVGLDISQFDEMTPYELNLHIEAYSEKIKRETEDGVILVWLGEYYHRLKKLPPLKKALEELTEKKKKQPMTDNEMLEVVKKLNAQFGGMVVKNEPQREESQIDSI